VVAHLKKKKCGTFFSLDLVVTIAHNEWSLMEIALQENGDQSHQPRVAVNEGLTGIRCCTFSGEACSVHTLITCLSEQVQLLHAEIICNHYDVTKGVILTEN